MTSPLNRRRVLGGVTATVLGLPVLAACGSDDPDTAADPTSPPASDSSSSEPSGSSAGGAALAATSEVPVGGCAVFADQKVVVTQPIEGEFKAFSSVCTHQGCPVSASSDGVIPCGCHGSEFSLEDGSVIQGPATAPLEAVEIVVDGDNIALA